MNAINELSRAFPDLAKTAAGFQNLRILKDATVYTYVVATYVKGDNGVACRSIDVVQCQGMPDVVAEEGVELIGSDVWLIENLRSLPIQERHGKGSLWRAYLLWCKAKDLRKSVADLKAWEDYDCVTLDTDVSNWVKGRRFAA